MLGQRERGVRAYICTAPTPVYTEGGKHGGAIVTDLDRLDTTPARCESDSIQYPYVIQIHDMYFLGSISRFSQSKVTHFDVIES